MKPITDQCAFCGDECLQGDIVFVDETVEICEDCYRHNEEEIIRVINQLHADDDFLAVDMG